MFRIFIFYNHLIKELITTQIMDLLVLMTDLWYVVNLNDPEDFISEDYIPLSSNSLRKINI